MRFIYLMWDLSIAVESQWGWTFVLGQDVWAGSDSTLECRAEKCFNTAKMQIFEATEITAFPSSKLSLSQYSKWFNYQHVNMTSVNTDHLEFCGPTCLKL